MQSAARGAAQPRIAELDGLRGAAIALVLLFHYGWGFFRFEPGSLGAYLSTPIRLAWSGVDLFFVLSGYFICGILLAARDSPNYYAAFYCRRALRILPLYCAMLVLFFAGVTLHRSGAIGAPRLFGEAAALWTYPFFLQNFLFALHGPQLNFLSVSWSLAIEEQFYLLFPLLIRKVRAGRVLALALTVIAVLAPLSRWVTESLAPGAAASANYVLPTARMDALAMGALIALWERHRTGESERLARLAAYLLLPAATVFMAWEVIVPGIFGPMLYTVTAMFYASLLLALRLGAPPLGWLFRRAWLQALGRISYCLYLVHIPVLGTLCVVAGLPDIALVGEKPRWITLCALAVSLAIAAASFRWFERPALEFFRPAARIPGPGAPP